MKHAKALLGYLKEIHSDQRLKNAGICCNVNELIYRKEGHPAVTRKFSLEVQKDLHDVMKKWPKHSHWESFPIPPVDANQDASDAFWNNVDNAWDKANPYCAQRWELLEFCIDYLEKGLAK